MIFKHRTGFWDLSQKFLVAGILNITPDSFSDGGKFLSENSAMKRVKEIFNQGADFIDIGGESTRPGSDPVSAEDEFNRIIPIIRKIKKSKITRDFIISVDTSKYEIAKAAVAEGADIINDVTAFNNDDRMFDLAAKTKVGVILMHSKGNPKTMQINPTYKNVISEISEFFEERVKKAIKSGIEKEKIVIDPGIGFGKTVEHNFQIIKNLKSINSKLNLPIMIGASRKSFIGKTLNAEVNNRLTGSVAAAVLAAVNGANILRVHDVLETKQALLLTEKTLFIN